MTAEKAVQLSSPEMMYLKNTGFLATQLAQIIKAAEVIAKDRHVVRVTPAVAEQCRSAFTERLAQVGFDSDYELTAEGKMLEELIDRFY